MRKDCEKRKGLGCALVNFNRMFINWEKLTWDPHSAACVDAATHVTHLDYPALRTNVILSPVSLIL